MNEGMLKLDCVSKQYKLGEIGGTTLRDELQRLRAKRCGKEDPTQRIGTKSYNKGETFMALDGVSFEVNKGERVGIIGHNGAGKSTLLKIISRVTAPTNGSIGLNGRVASMLEVGTGFHQELTGRENIYMNGAILGMTKKEIDSKIEDIVEFSECRQFIDTPVKRYSSGMYVKLAFSVAAHLDSEIMIMDEVLAVGDAVFQKKCLGKMRDVAQKEGRTILYVSHNMNTIRQLCNRVIVLNHGKVVFDGGVEEGISIYMNSDDDCRIEYDFSDYVHRSFDKLTVQFLRLYILERNNNKVQIGDILKIKLHCVANEDAIDLGVRFEVCFMDDTIVGTTFLSKSINAMQGEKFDLYISIPTDNFTPGKYRFIGLVYEKDQHGGQASIERVDPAMVVEMIDENEGSLIWQHQYWGHTHLDNMTLEKIETKSKA